MRLFSLGIEVSMLLLHCDNTANVWMLFAALAVCRMTKGKIRCYGFFDITHDSSSGILALTFIIASGY